ncbi:hypothetical protein LZ554_001440 [Drepanopeziza brunnea f. sp. 'monogermtubi']|nr:hypothetical protein LZ554_001440 [Drepanopeziza brunnea f. sp. 'monogermtubi']
MVSKSFYLVGTAADSAQDIKVDLQSTFEVVQYAVAQQFSIAVPSGVLVDGNPVRDVPGPRGLPIAGSYYEVYPDHLGNHQRLFDQYGPVFKTTDMVRNMYYTNDPALADVCFAKGASGQRRSTVITRCTESRTRL